MPDTTPLYSPRDWDAYRASLDSEYQHQHYGGPTQFPCLVLSHWYDDPNGPYCYQHMFIYEDDVRTLWRQDPERVENTPQGFLVVKVLAHTDLNPVKGHLTRGETYQYTLDGDYVLLQKLNSTDSRLVLSQAHFGRLQTEERLALYQLTEV